MYGAQTSYDFTICAVLFENDVEMYGAQTEPTSLQSRAMFENDVEMYGAQTAISCSLVPYSLRMM